MIDEFKLQKKILVAEDNPINLEVVLCMLEGVGCTVRAASNGNEALEALSEDSYDMVLMDCAMPELDGYKTTAQIRCHEAQTNARHMPVVAVTAKAQENDRERCLMAGMDDYLSKPFSRKQLVDMLAQWLIDPDGAVDEKELASCAQGKQTAAREIGTESAIVDRTVLARLRSLQKPGQSDFLGRLVASYIESSPVLLKKLVDAVENTDAQAMKDAAHSLKSSSANLGAHALSQLCQVLETRGVDGSTANSEEILNQILSMYPGVCDALKLEVQDQGAT